MPLVTLFVLTLLAAAQAQTTPAAGAELRATVTYNGAAKVDDTHEIWVFLFDDPNIGPGSTPVAVEKLAKNGGTVTFKGITADPVYVAVAFDEKGDYDGTAAPPPDGTPIGIYVNKEGQPAPIKPGAKASITFAFDEKVRMGRGY